MANKENEKREGRRRNLRCCRNPPANERTSPPRALSSGGPWRGEGGEERCGRYRKMQGRLDNFAFCTTEVTQMKYTEKGSLPGCVRGDRADCFEFARKGGFTR